MTSTPARRTPPLLYVSFDQVPTAKGASTHIEANARALGGHFGSLVLLTPGPRDVAARPFAPGVRQVVLGCPDSDLIGRVLTFRAKLAALLRRQPFDLIHFRSPYEGYPLARARAALGARLLYEVNGLPSFELRYAQPRLAGDDILLAKLIHQERACLAAADRVITVSQVNRACLLRLGCDPDKIVVLPNGVDLAAFPYRDPAPAGHGPLRVLYVGTLSRWQGIEVLLDAVQLAGNERAIHLGLAGPANRERLAELHSHIRRAGLESRVTILPPVPRAQVAGLFHDSHVTAVPLTAADRNTVQGCCPLKLLEAMAAGCPVVASDLPVVRELADPGAHFLPVPPGDVAALSGAIVQAGSDHEATAARARAARRHVEQHFTWQNSTNRLIALYEELLGSPASSAARPACSAAGE